jgi:hypothetical protein
VVVDVAAGVEVVKVVGVVDVVVAAAAVTEAAAHRGAAAVIVEWMRPYLSVNAAASWSIQYPTDSRPFLSALAWQAICHWSGIKLVKVHHAV